MGKHSNLVGGSTAGLVRKCNYSLVAKKGVPPEKSSEYALEGTALHSLMEAALGKYIKAGPDMGVRIAEDYIKDKTLQVYDEVKMSAVMIEQKALPSFRWFRDNIPTGDFIELECEVSFNTLDDEGEQPFGVSIDGAFGTADVVFDCEESNRAGIVDWKFGEGILVDPEDNDQMRFYLAAAIHSGFLPVIDEYEAWIYQPAFTKLESSQYAKKAVYTFDELKAFVLDLEDAVYSEPVANTGGHCWMCKGKTRCDAYKKFLTATVDTDVESVDSDELSKYLDMLPSLTDFAKQVRAIALRNAQAGIRIPGYKLETSLGDRAYVSDESTVIAALGRLGMEMKERTVRKPISPAQAERALKALDLPKERIERFFKTHVKRPDRGEKLVPSKTADVDDFAAMADTLEVFKQ